MTNTMKEDMKDQYQIIICCDQLRGNVHNSKSYNYLIIWKSEEGLLMELTLETQGAWITAVSLIEVLNHFKGGKNHETK